MAGSLKELKASKFVALLANRQKRFKNANAQFPNFEDNATGQESRFCKEDFRVGRLSIVTYPFEHRDESEVTVCLSFHATVLLFGKS